MSNKYIPLLKYNMKLLITQNPCNTKNSRSVNYFSSSANYFSGNPELMQRAYVFKKKSKTLFLFFNHVNIFHEPIKYPSDKNV